MAKEITQKEHDIIIALHESRKTGQEIANEIKRNKGTVLRHIIKTFSYRDEEARSGAFFGIRTEAYYETEEDIMKYARVRWAYIN